MSLIDVTAALARAVVTWEDIRWLKRIWTGPIVVKGVLTAEDAKRAVDEGAAAIDRKSTRLNSSHGYISYAVFCLKKKNNSHVCSPVICPSPRLMDVDAVIDSRLS